MKIEDKDLALGRWEVLNGRLKILSENVSQDCNLINANINIFLLLVGIWSIIFNDPILFILVVIVAAFRIILGLWDLKKQVNLAEDLLHRLNKELKHGKGNRRK